MSIITLIPILMNYIRLEISPIKYINNLYDKYLLNIPKNYSIQRARFSSSPKITPFVRNKIILLLSQKSINLFT